VLNTIVLGYVLCGDVGVLYADMYIDIYIYIFRGRSASNFQYTECPRWKGQWEVIVSVILSK
jgi:hypothetical protein